ncbi:MAG: FKBP-type peptidyl-prolyl cis-trans isomerase [Rhodoluna sp.]|nr:FKBP-type peptidyl-prolyl cis-trans isomerase [Rhodoluna sp.]
MRKLLAAVFAVVIATSLTACAPRTASDMFTSLKAECGTAKEGKNVAQVTTTQTAGSKVPTLNFPIGIDSKTIETKVITEGKGPKITGGQYINFEFAQAVGATGKVSGNSKFDGTDAQSQFLDASSNLCKAFGGVREGSRVALLIPSSIMSAGEKVPSSGVIVFDIKKVYLPHAVGDEQGNQNGLPTVIRATNGQPTVQFANGSAPKELTVVPLIKGWGEQIASDHGEKVMIHYAGWVWNTHVKFDSSWDNKRPVQFDLATRSLIDGMVKGLNGQTVGSQVLLVIPPSLGYKAQELQNIPANSTLIFVVDILGVTK